MINVKPIIYRELKKITDNVTDGFPANNEKFPCIIYTEEDNTPYEIVDGEEVTSAIKYRVEIWDKKSTSQLAIKVNNVFHKLGLYRKSSHDILVEENFKSKEMRFEGIIDVDTQLVYQHDYE